MNLLRNRDLDNHSALDWAAEGGDVNVIECILRMDRLLLQKVDSEGRTPLHWAVTNGRVLATRYLIQAGLSPLTPDNNGITALDIVKKKSNTSAYHDLLLEANRTKNSSSSIISFEVRQASPSLRMMAIYTLLLFFSWILLLAVPYYICLPLLAGVFFLFLKINQYLRHIQRATTDFSADMSSSSTGSSLQDPPLPSSLFSSLLLAPEKYLGLYLATLLVTLIYLANCISASNDHNGGILQVRTETSYTQQSTLFGVNFGLLAGSVLLWWIVVWASRDPGQVKSRPQDFIKVKRVPAFSLLFVFSVCVLLLFFYFILY